MGDLTSELTPTQEHFLKKYLLEQCIAEELHELSQPDCCLKIGYPFLDKSSFKDTTGPGPEAEAEAEAQAGPEAGTKDFPLVRYVFQRFVVTFPFLSHNSLDVQIRFWQKTVQPFVESFNLKPISSSEERMAKVTKRRQVNHKLLSAMLFFFNSTIVSPKDLEYFKSEHLKPSDTGNIDKLSTSKKSKGSSVKFTLSLDDVKHMKFHNNVSLNVVAVRTNESSRNKLLLPSFLSTDSTPKNKHEYIIHVVHKLEDGLYTKHFVNRGYKEFHSLHSKLMGKFPGIGLPLLPLKPKHDDDPRLGKEKLRLALRGYLMAIVSFSEVVHSSIFVDFSSLGKYDTMQRIDEPDYKKRVVQEKKMLETQRHFQQITSVAIKQLSHSLESFKAELIGNPHTLSKVISEIGATSDIKKMSPLLQTFNESSKLEIAALLYQTFISQDNSSEWLLKIRRFHRLFPHTVVYGILRITNPAKIISKIIDLLLVNMPTLPSWGSNSKPNEARNLLSYMFISIMDEDLSDNQKELTELKKLIPPDLYDFIERIESYTSLTTTEVNYIKDCAIDNKHDLCMEVLLTDMLSPKLSFTDTKLAKVIENLYTSYKAGDMKKGEIYLLLCQYWQLKVRQRDNELFKQLWKEPELTKLIKDFLTTFYHPLMDLFCKCSIHLVFRDFQHFMDDFIELFTELSNSGQYYESPIAMYTAIKALLDKHDSMFWKFANNVYSKDDKHLFYNITRWIEMILVNIRVKQNKPELVTIQFVADEETIDKQLFIEQINSRVSRSVEKRRLVKEFLESTNSKKLQEEEEEYTTYQEQIDKDWDKIHSEMVSGMAAEDFGLISDEVDELNFDQKQITDSEKELRERIKQLDQQVSIVGTSELDKFIDGFKSQLREILPKLHHELGLVQ